MRIYVTLLSIAALLPAFCQGVIVAERGVKPQYAIRFASDAGENVRYAADELRDYVDRITGTKLPIVSDGTMSTPQVKESESVSGVLSAEIHVPPVPSPRSIVLREIKDPSLGDDGFTVRMASDGDVMVSGGKRGVLYAVYELLERYGGVGWFASWRTVVPQCERFELPEGLYIREKPAFPVRTTAWLDSKRNGDFCARLRLNGVRCPVEAKHGGSGMRPARGNGHTFHRYMPPKEFFAEHPEYYALDEDGKRNPGQPCLTHPEVLAIFKERVLGWMRKYSDGDLYMVTQNDNHIYCRCDGCRRIYEEEGSPSGAVLRFVNAIAEHVEHEFPDKVVETYAYMWSQEPPRHVRPRRNVMIYLCNDGTQGPPYLNRHKTLLEQRNTRFSFAKTLEAWAKVARRIHIFDYNTNFSRTFYAFPIELTFAPNLRFYRDCGVEYVNGYGGEYTLHSDFAELKLWLYAKLAWNPDQDVQSLLARFFEGYYGTAAPMARAAFDILQREYPSDKCLGMYQRNEVVYSDETLRKCETLWVAALAAVKGDEVLERNVRMSALTVAWMRFERRPLPKRFFATCNPEAFAFQDAESIWLVSQIRAALAECRDIRLAENKVDRDEQLAMLSLVENPPAPPKNCVGKLLLEEKSMTRLAWSNRAKFEDDPKAGDGKAMRCFNKSHGPSAQLSFADIAFDSGAKYRIRVRARIDRGEAEDTAAAFSLYVRRKGHGSPLAANGKKRMRRTWKVSEVSEEYAWYELPEWTPRGDEVFFVMRGSCDAWPKNFTAKDVPDSVWIDCIEIIREL